MLKRHRNDARHTFLGTTAGNQRLDDISRFEAEVHIFRRPTQHSSRASVSQYGRTIIELTFLRSMSRRLTMNSRRVAVNHIPVHSERSGDAVSKARPA
jgi:hypothetical protein